MSSARKGSSPGEKKPQLSEDMQKCLTVIHAMMDHPEAAPFSEPVDWEAYGLLDYPTIIKRPMDASTVEQKLLAGEYATMNKFAVDMRLIYKNAQTYNRSDSEIYKAAEMLAKLFEKKFSKIKKKEETAAGKKRQSSAVQRDVTRQDRVAFSQLVNQLTAQQLGVMVNMIQKDCPEALNEEDDDELEIEVNNLDGNTLLLLLEFANNSVNTQARKKLK